MEKLGNGKVTKSIALEIMCFRGKSIHEDKKERLLKKETPTRAPFYRYTEEDLPFVSYYTIYMLYRQYLIILLAFSRI